MSGLMKTNMVSSSTIQSSSTLTVNPVVNNNSINNTENRSDINNSEINKKTDINLNVTNSNNNGVAVMVSLIAGASAGAVAKTTIAPLDRTKINFQINKDIPYSLRSALQFIHKTFEKEGFIALWRGNSATMARIIPYAAIQFTAYEQWKKLLNVDKEQSTNVRRFLAGSLAGITSQSMTYPLDLARARMAVTDKNTGYRTLRHVFRKIWVTEGPKTLFRGYWATIMGVIPYAGMSFFTYETLKRKYYDITGEKKPTPIYSLLFGAMAGIIGQTSSYPLDIVRRRMQTIGIIKGTEDQYSTILSTLRNVYRQEGVKGGFFKGLSMNWIKGPIAAGISFATYEFVKDFLKEFCDIRKP